MNHTRIDKHALPDHDGSDIDVVVGNGLRIGVMKFDGKGNSRLELSKGQLPWRRWPLKKKYRAR